MFNETPKIDGYEEEVSGPVHIPKQHNEDFEVFERLWEHSKVT